MKSKILIFVSEDRCPLFQNHATITFTTILSVILFFVLVFLPSHVLYGDL
jgi:hypothetical protein